MGQSFERMNYILLDFYRWPVGQTFVAVSDLIPYLPVYITIICSNSYRNST